MEYLSLICLFLIVVWLIIASYQEGKQELGRLNSLDGEWAEPKWR